MRRFTYKSSNFNTRNTALGTAFFTGVEVARAALLQRNVIPDSACTFSQKKNPG